MIEKGGRIYRLNVATGAKTLELTVANLSTTNERGLIGITTGPRTTGAGLAAYVVATATDGTVELRQYAITAAGAFEMPANPVVMLSIPHSAANHNGGWIEFGPDGLLYMAGRRQRQRRQCAGQHCAPRKILRLALTSSGWGPAPGNPYVGGGGGDPYIFALGLRNPFRNAFEGNNLIVADVGEGNVEEVDIIPVTQAGTNFGWPYKEGTRNNRGTVPAGLTLTGPVLQYTHGNGPLQGGSITGGRVYHGPIASLEGQYFFGDYVSRAMSGRCPCAHALRAAARRDGLSAARHRSDCRRGRDQPAGRLQHRQARRFYIVDLDGEIFRIDPG